MNFIFIAVDSNDTLYGYDPKFLGELKQISGTLITEILNHLKTLDKPEVQLKYEKLDIAN